MKKRREDIETPEVEPPIHRLPPSTPRPRPVGTGTTAADPLTTQIEQWMAGMQGSQGTQASPTGATLTPPPADPDVDETVLPPGPAPVGSDAPPVAGSQHINFGYLYGLNQDKAGAQAKRLAAEAQRRARKAKGDVQAAAGTFNRDLLAGSGAGYNGEYIPTSQPTTTRYNADGTASVKQGLAGSPQKSGSGLPAGAITQTEALARSQQKYTGPDGLADYGSLLEGATKAQSFAEGLGGDSAALQGTLADWLGNLGGYGVNPAGTSVKGRWTGALLGAAGGDEFRELAKRYGSLVEDTQATQADAEARAKAAGIKTEEDAKLYDTALGDYLGTQKALDARAAEGSRAPAPKATKPTYEEFQGQSRKTPLGAIINGADGDDQVRTLPKDVYDELTPEEFEALRKMSPGDFEKWWEVRLAERERWGPRSTWKHRKAVS